MNELNTYEVYTLNSFRFIYQKYMQHKIDSNVVCSLKNKNLIFLCYKNLHNIKLFILTMLNVLF